MARRLTPEGLRERLDDPDVPIARPAPGGEPQLAQLVGGRQLRGRLAISRALRR